MGEREVPVWGIRTTAVSILSLGMLFGSAVGVAASDEDTMPLPEGGPLEPGTYIDDEYLGPTVRFTVGEGWGVRDTGDELIQLGWGGTGRQFVSLTLFDGRVNVAPCHLPDEGLEGDFAVMDVTRWLVQPENVLTIEATQSGLWDHLAANPNLAVGEPMEMLVDGRVGQQADVTPLAGEGCFEEATFLWHTPYEGAWVIANGERARFTTFEAGDDVLVVDARTTDDEADHDSFLAAVDNLVATLVFTEPALE
jgi:hypothetical protein